MKVPHRPLTILVSALVAVGFVGHAGDSVAAPPPAPALPATLSLEQALQIFRSQGLDLLIAEAQVEGAAADVRSAGAIPNPNVSAGYSHSFFAKGLFETSHGWFASVGDSNAIEDSLSGKRGLRERVAEASLAAAKLQRADAERTLALEVKQQYFQVVAATASQVFAREVTATLGRTFELTQIRYKSGAISEVDLAKIETAKLESEQAVDSAAETLRQSKVALAFLLGQRKTFSDFTVDEHQLRFVVPRGLAHATADELVSRALAARPDVLAQSRQRERARSAATLARRQRVPDIGIDAQYQQEGTGNTAPNAPSAITPPTLTLGLTATLPLFYQQQGEVRKADADIQLQDLELTKLDAQVVSDVEASFSGYETSQRLVQRMEGRLLERAKRSRELVEIQYQKGAASLLEYLDAQRTYIAVNLEYLQDLTGYWSAVFQLEAATASELIK